MNIIVFIISTIILHLTYLKLETWKACQILSRKGCSLPETNNTKIMLLLPGPECDDETPGCQQFHFMPRFVRFLPGETLNNSQRTCTAFLEPPVSLWWSVFMLKGNRKRSCMTPVTLTSNISAYAGVDICSLVSAKWLTVPELLCSCMVFTFGTHDGAGAL